MEKNILIVPLTWVEGGKARQKEETCLTQILRLETKAASPTLSENCLILAYASLKQHANYKKYSYSYPHMNVEIASKNQFAQQSFKNVSPNCLISKFSQEIFAYRMVLSVLQREPSQANAQQKVVDMKSLDFFTAVNEMEDKVFKFFKYYILHRVILKCIIFLPKLYQRFKNNIIIFLQKKKCETQQGAGDLASMI